MSILKNEKYKGDALLQKTFTQDFLTKKMKVNEGEVPQYYVTGSHPAIIKPEEWDLVQLEMEKRRNRPGKHTASNFCGKIICADCGGPYGRKVWHSNDKYKTVIYQCNCKHKKGCKTPHVPEETLKNLFIQAYSMFYDDRQQIAEDLNELLSKCCETTFLKKKLKKIEHDIELVYSGMQKCVSDNASALLSEREYKEKYTALKEKYEKLKKEHSRIKCNITKFEHDQAEINRLIGILNDSSPIPMVYDNALFNMVVDKVVVDRDYMVRFYFTGGKEYEFEI